jgi:glycosyltransferase involved in cell wall biosynthesis
MSLDVLIISKADYANAGYLYGEALKSVGVEAEAWAVRPSPNRGYGKYAKHFTNLFDDILPKLREAKAVQLMHSRRFPSLPLDGKFVVVFHGGSRYRMRPDEMNQIFNPIVDKSIIQTGDLLGLGAKNEEWVLPCIDVDDFEPQIKPTQSKRIIAHYPHKGYVKGTETIYNVLWQVHDQKSKCANTKGWKFLIDDKHLPWRENLERIAKCDVYIEAMNPTLREKPYGEWGLTALEAAALGKVVITHFQSYKRYAKEYGPCPLIVANSRSELVKAVKYVLRISHEDLQMLKVETRNWVERNHSFKAVGERLMQKVYGDFLENTRNITSS